MTRLFIARLRSPEGERPLITVRAAAEGEARLFLEAHYPDDTVEAVAEPEDWVSDSDTGAAPGDIREHQDAAWPDSAEPRL
ncbi:hypothetical protein [Methylobacterium segetis]|uniref:hypothetical protein n=1 Tax=Methylobacterium segetis TaxID=2488750 RepID=UPI00104AF51E|nr:hypothetical protein [Methylobacterium segetis]